MALAKIVGLDVTPRTCRSRISISRLPVARRSLLMSSSHTDTPAAVSWPSASSGREFMTSTPCCHWACCGAQPGQAGAGRAGDPLSCYPELLIQCLVGGGGPEVLEADALAEVTGERPPAKPDPRLDADPGPDRVR